MKKLRAALKAGIEQYSGHKVTNIKVHADPQVEGTYAIRTKVVGEKESFDWLIVGYNEKLTTQEIEHKLEECEFKSWPPVSGNLQFFW